jgi:hypothetical protein
MQFTDNKQKFMRNLIFRRQYLLTSKEITLDPTWKKINLQKIRMSFMLYVHPDLDMIQAGTTDFEIILLGYLIDPYNPTASSQDIVSGLADSKDFDEIINTTFRLNGRFVIIYNDKETIRVFNDPCGLREVYYTNDKDNIACGSTPDIIAEFLNVPRTSNTDINDFFKSPEFARKGRIWLGKSTMIQHVNHLLPNHSLHLLENKVTRFWPAENRKTMPIAEAATKMAKILTGTFDAAVSRFELHQSLTSGWDTKLLLAASRKHTDKIHFYFNRGFKSDCGVITSVDYEIAQKISRDNNFPLEIVESENEIVEKEFDRIYKSNNILARTVFQKVFFNRYRMGFENTTNASGTSGNEILRVVSLINRNIKNSMHLARIFGYESFNYVLNEMEQWFQDSAYVTNLNYKLIDLFYWEQLIGNWGALGAAEQDIVREEFRPFNNREFISIYWSLKDSQRYTDYPAGHVYIVRLLWKELLAYRMDIDRYKIKLVLRATGLEQFCYKLFSWVRKYMK